MKTKSLAWVAFAFCVLAFMLTGCGAENNDENAPNSPTNLAPVADAGQDRLVQQSALVELDGSSSSDEDGQIVSYNWVQTRGTSVLLSDADTVSPSFIAPQTDTREELAFVLTVHDNDGAQNSDTVTITVNVPPIADAGADQTLFLNNPSIETVTLAGIFGDIDGDVIAHQWVQTGGPTVDLTGSDTPSATFNVPATTTAYTFSYTVTDNDGGQTTETVSVYVSKIIFSDSFSDGSGWQNRWTPMNDTANLGEWNVLGGQLRQERTLTAVNAFQGGNTSYHLATYALLVDPSINGVSSYRFSVDITPVPNNNGVEGNDVGIMFGYQDNLNYYRVSLNARFGYTRFEKRINGLFETLAVNAVGYVNRQQMRLSAELNGNTIVVWIDGAPVFAIVDDDILSGGIALYCKDRNLFDNVLIIENPLQPMVVISKPLAYSVALTRDEGDELSAEAIVLNKPEDGSVWFAMDDGPETPADEWWDNIYGVDFAGVSSGNHDVTAVLRCAEGKEVSHDINAMVGIGGDYYVTVGDSITNGVGDFNPFNNDSIDGRIVSSQGFQASLADQLTETTDRPQILFNEGIGGDTASDLKARIDSILERHPGANKVLLMIGTNDANRSVDPTVFRNQVTGTIAKINGRQVWLAKPMPTFINDSPLSWTLNDTRNNRIQQYNAELEQIAASNTNAFLGPDFYTIFSSFTTPSDVYADHLHPNDAGYVFMADRWHDVLVQ